MSRRKTFLAGSIALIVAVSLLTGCGSDQDRAADLSRKGDALLDQVKAEVAALSDAVGGVFSQLSSSLSSGGKPNTEVLASGMAGVESSITKVRNQAERARSYYKEIESLSGVEDYARYAATQIRVIDTSLAGLNALDGLLKKTLAMARAPSFDAPAFMAVAQQSAEQLKKIGEHTAALERQAEQLKKEKHL